MIRHWIHSKMNYLRVNSNTAKLCQNYISYIMQLMYFWHNLAIFVFYIGITFLLSRGILVRLTVSQACETFWTEVLDNENFVLDGQLEAGREKSSWAWRSLKTLYSITVCILNTDCRLPKYLSCWFHYQDPNVYRYIINSLSTDPLFFLEFIEIASLSKKINQAHKPKCKWDGLGKDKIRGSLERNWILCISRNKKIPCVKMSLTRRHQVNIV